MRTVKCEPVCSNLKPQTLRHSATLRDTPRAHRDWENWGIYITTKSNVAYLFISTQVSMGSALNMIYPNRKWAVGVATSRQIPKSQSRTLVCVYFVLNKVKTVIFTVYLCQLFGHHISTYTDQIWHQISDCIVIFHMIVLQRKTQFIKKNETS